MTVALLTSDERHSRRGEHVSALAQRLTDATVVTIGTATWPGSVHVDEVAGSFDVAAAFGWRACLHLGRVTAGAYAYYVPSLEDAQMWQGDEQRVLATLTYDLPLPLLVPSN